MNRRFKSGFRAYEYGLVVVVLAVIGALIAPRFASASEQANVVSAADDMRAIAEALNEFHSTHGYYPSDMPVGRIPPEIRYRFEKNIFEQASPIGGIYDYQNTDSKAPKEIVIRSTLTTPAPTIVDAQALDALIDDGVLNSGRFRSTADGGYTFVLNQ